MCKNCNVLDNIESTSHLRRRAKHDIWQKPLYRVGRALILRSLSPSFITRDYRFTCAPAQHNELVSIFARWKFQVWDRLPGSLLVAFWPIGSAWRMFLIPIAVSWSLLVPIAFYWPLLASIASHWVLLTTIGACGGYWSLLAPIIYQLSRLRPDSSAQPAQRSQPSSKLYSKVGPELD